MKTRRKFKKISLKDLEDMDREAKGRSSAEDLKNPEFKRKILARAEAIRGKVNPLIEERKRAMVAWNENHSKKVFFSSSNPDPEVQKLLDEATRLAGEASKKCSATYHELTNLYREYAKLVENYPTLHLEALPKVPFQDMAHIG
jgi:hypothetical protein